MKIFPPPNQSRPVVIKTMDDVKCVLETQGPPYLLRALRTLQSHCHGQPLANIPADAEWIEAHFPRVCKGKHPRPDLGQKVEAYKKWRTDLLRAVNIATGAKAQVEESRARIDGWSPLIDALKLHSTNGGLVHAGAVSSVVKLADIARHAGMEPKNLADDDSVVRLRKFCFVKREINLLRAAIRLLETFRFLPEVDVHLPKGHLTAVPTLREAKALPEHIDAAIVAMADVASACRDEVAGEDSRRVSESQVGVYQASLRYHIRMLQHAPDEPKFDYRNSVRNLENVSDIMELFSPEHIKAGIRETQRRDGQPAAISQRTAAGYYGTLLTILEQNGVDVAELRQSLKTSRYIREGKQLGQSMTQRTKQFCEALINDPKRERLFYNMHRVLQAKANEILELAAFEGRPLTNKELTRVRSFGTCAAVSAIEIAGRPIRMSNALGLRCHGSRANFFPPKGYKRDYSFHLTAEETKADKEEPTTILRKELYGPQVIEWYLAKIRPLFAHASSSIYLFPAVEDEARPLGKGTFDTWFQRATGEAGLPMSMHNWRHGYATLLLDQDWGNLGIAADLLGNTPGVCAKSYCWINQERLYKQGQNMLIARSRRVK